VANWQRVCAKVRGLRMGGSGRHRLGTPILESRNSLSSILLGKYEGVRCKGCGNSPYPFYGSTNGRIASLYLACVAIHTALGTPSTASRQRYQKQNIGNFCIPKRLKSIRSELKRGDNDASQFPLFFIVVHLLIRELDQCLGIHPVFRIKRNAHAQADT